MHEEITKALNELVTQTEQGDRDRAIAATVQAIAKMVNETITSAIQKYQDEILILWLSGGPAE